MSKAKGGRGRRCGSRNRGYFYRKGRGWYAKVGTCNIPLRYANGQPIKAKDSDPQEVRQAYLRFQMVQAEQAAADQRAAAASSLDPGTGLDPNLTVADICAAYLAYCQTDGSPTTYASRADTLFDLCFALPGRFRPKNGQPLGQQPADIEARHKARCPHPPYGTLAAAKLTPPHVDAWLAAHPTWKGSRRMKIQALKRALNFAVERRLLAENPIAGYKVGRTRGRITYFTPEQEAAMLKHAHPALRLALQVCIRTGLRYGAEFIPLSAQQIVDLGERMEWRVTPKKTKTSQKYRLVRVTDPEVLALTRRQIKRHPAGPVFRNESGTPWNRDNLTVACCRLRKRVTRLEGIQFDADACMNTCRHTYAKRTLQGYWTGKPTTIETLARLMGNTPQVCWDHYVQWCDAYNEALWEAC